VSEPTTPAAEQSNPQLGGTDTRVRPDAGPTEGGRPLLMDPAGARPPGFAPPTASPWAPGAPTVAARPGPPNTHSVLAGPTPVTPAPTLPASRSEAAFGPVSRVVTISIRTPSSRVDLALPDRTSIAEVLETVLDVAPRSLREQALAHGGWILRTAAGRPLPGATTLLDEGIGNGTTLFLAGGDTADPAVVYDDVADAVADAVQADSAGWPAGAGRAFALGGTAAFGGLTVLGVVELGPPWTAPALVLAALAVGTQVVAAVVARRAGDGGIALTLGLLSVVAGAVAAIVAAGAGEPGGPGPLPWLLGAVTAALLAGTASLAVGGRRVPFGAIITGTGLLAVGLACGTAFDLGSFGTAAVVCGLAVCVMPILPGLSLRLAAFEPDPMPTTTREVAAARRRVDTSDVRARTGRAVGLLTAFVQGCAWPALAAGIVLAFGGQPAGQALSAVVGLALLLRARLFPTVGQRLPLLLGGMGCLLAVPTGMLVQAASPITVIMVCAATGAAAVVCAAIAGRRTPRSPMMARAAEIIDLLLTIAVIPLVAAVLGAFAFVRGLGG